MMTVAERFGLNLRAGRQKVGYSQELLADRAAVHRTEVSLLERGLRAPGLETFFKLMVSLDVEAADLLVGLDWRIGTGVGTGDLLVDELENFFLP